MIVIPKLPHNCNSWVVVRIWTGEIVGEFWNKELIEKLDETKFKVLTSLEHLQVFNRLLANKADAG